MVGRLLKNARKPFNGKAGALLLEGQHGMDVASFQVIRPGRYQRLQATFGFVQVTGLRQLARLCQGPMPILVAVG